MLTDENGTEIKGEFKKSKLDGECEIRYINGSIYKGRCKNN